VTSLLETILQVLTFLLLFLGSEDFGRRTLAVGLGVGVCDTDVKDTIGSSGPETPDQEIPSFIFRGCFLSGGVRLIGIFRGQNVHFLSNATGSNEGFVAYC
jgi:hypothetical protein